jgi:sacsin
MFNTLPLPISSDLPIHIHATFSLSGDRQSIAVDEYGIQSHGSEWNRYLLQDALPKLYLLFLDDIGTQVRQGVFTSGLRKSRPKEVARSFFVLRSGRNCPGVHDDFSRRLNLTMGLRQRRAAELFDINQAVFDFLPKSESEVLAALLIALKVKLGP